MPLMTLSFYSNWKIRKNSYRYTCLNKKIVELDPADFQSILPNKWRISTIFTQHIQHLYKNLPDTSPYSGREPYI